jgi:hypothetical protein
MGYIVHARRNVGKSYSIFSSADSTLLGYWGPNGDANGRLHYLHVTKLFPQSKMG